MFDVYVGFDRRNDGQMLAYEICEESMKKNSATPDQFRVHQLHLGNLIEQGVYWRKDDVLAATEFTYSRFLAPALNKFTGMAVFCDSDFLWECDIVQELTPYFEQMKEQNLAVMCVQHDYVPAKDKKMDGRAQTVYVRKNWSSMILFNCDHPDVQKLTVEAVNSQSPAWLHRFHWCEDQNIGALPHDFNYLVGVYHDLENPRVIHYTDGGPWHYLYRDAELTEKWFPYLSDSQRQRLEAELKRQQEELGDTEGVMRAE